MNPRLYDYWGRNMIGGEREPILNSSGAHLEKADILVVVGESAS
jgi:hypothetical protein